MASQLYECSKVASFYFPAAPGAQQQPSTSQWVPSVCAADGHLDSTPWCPSGPLLLQSTSIHQQTGLLFCTRTVTVPMAPATAVCQPGCWYGLRYGLLASALPCSTSLTHKLEHSTLLLKRSNVFQSHSHRKIKNFHKSPPWPDCQLPFWLPRFSSPRSAPNTHTIWLFQDRTRHSPTSVWASLCLEHSF